MYHISDFFLMSIDLVKITWSVFAKFRSTIFRYADLIKRNDFA